jgi:hypothetical protein
LSLNPRAFHQAVLDHATAEESEVFPLLERSCPAGELHTMAERIKKAEDIEYSLVADTDEPLDTSLTVLDSLIRAEARGAQQRVLTNPIFVRP